MSANAELSSVATTLDELLARVGTIADRLVGPEQEAVTSELLEVERALGTASRRLRRLLDSNPP
ncbi:MAG TPA: hypothetical protein VLL25_05875 [Acidimicrobiales bacterium]|jgi:hypothetical protein|nr:hypothetical protein [Acidimicrobiales bacterium]